MKFLRDELNRERSWEYAFFKDQGKDRKIKPERAFEMKQRQKQERISSIQMAIHVLKLAKKMKHLEKPEYYWLHPNTKI